MRAVVRSLMSLDVDDLEAWAPQAVEWALGLRILAGPDDGPGEESFDFTICNPGWLSRRVRRDGVFDGRHHLIVERYDWRRIEAYVRNRVAACSGSDWNEVAAKLSRFAYWEFEDYVEQ